VNVDDNSKLIHLIH